MRASVNFNTIVFISLRTVAIGILFFISSCDFQSSSLAPSRKAPELKLEDLDGNPVSLDSFIGKPVVLNFLASWCLPCAEEMPDLEELHRVSNGKITVVAVGVEDSRVALRKFKEDNKVSFPFLHEPKGLARSRYRLAGYPETVVLDSQGRIVMLPDPDLNGEPVIKFVGPRKWSSEKFKKILSAVK